MEIKLVTFDAAGTLISHTWDPAAIAIRAAEQVGIAIDPKLGHSICGAVWNEHQAERIALERVGDRSGIEALWLRQMREWLEGCGAEADAAADTLAAFKQIAFAKGSFTFTLYHDVRPTLRNLRALNKKLAIISNWDHTLHEVLNNTGIADDFDFVLISLEFGYEKPQQEIFAEALRRADVSAEQTVHVGDSYEDDVFGAKRAGMHAFHLIRDGQTDFSRGQIATLCEIEGAIRCL